MEEKRQHPRWSIAKRVTYKEKDNNEELGGLSSDISVGGLCLFAEKQIQPETILDIKLEIDRDPLADPLVGRVKVLWQKEEPENNVFRTGLSFVYLGDLEKEKIFNYAFGNKREDFVQRWWQGLT